VPDDIETKLRRSREHVLALIAIIDDHKVSTVDYEDSVIRVAQYEAESGELWPPPELRQARR
jgi:hypothetical protein